MQIIGTILFVLSVFLFSPSIAQQRYVDSLFVVVQTDTNRVYATAPQLTSQYAGESATENVNLTMHVFQPANDAELRRPMLLCFHGGAFVSGTKEHDDMLAFCRQFASRGYVTASVQYRLGMNVVSAVSGTRSVYRALQDCRAAIRYIKHNAVQLKIDTAKIFALGSSAGGFIGLHTAYMNKESEKPASANAINNFPPTLDNGPDLGALDAIESIYRYGGMPNGVISLWGGLKDTILIEQTDTTPLFLVHGTSDNIVPFNVGTPFNLTTLPATYGSNPIHQRLSNLHIDHQTYFVDGAGHEFYGVTNGMWSPSPNAYWDTVVTKVTQFLYPRVVITSARREQYLPNIFVLYQNYPNPFNPTTTISYQLSAKDFITLNIFDILGREVATLLNEVKEAGNYSVKFDASKLSGGMYFAKLTTEHESQIKKILLIK